MALSTSPAFPTERAPSFEALRVATLQRFYSWHAWFYDLTRPSILFGRADLLAGLRFDAEEVVLDVGCGTGWALERLALRGARVRGIDCSPDMLNRARARARRLGWTGLRVTFDSRPFGTHTDYRSAADAIVFSYSLTMIPPFSQVLASARAALRSGGRIAVVDFLEARSGLVDRWLSANHVHLGPARLELLRTLFPRHRIEIRRAPLWSYYLLWGERD
jgi:S-adenosylmethionine-diacylgycerolhomoserine-N-methlytransferase